MGGYPYDLGNLHMLLATEATQVGFRTLKRAFIGKNEAFSPVKFCMGQSRKPREVAKNQERRFTDMFYLWTHRFWRSNHVVPAGFGACAFRNCCHCCSENGISGLAITAGLQKIIWIKVTADETKKAHKDHGAGSNKHTIQMIRCKIYCKIWLFRAFYAYWSYKFVLLYGPYLHMILMMRPKKQ